MNKDKFFAQMTDGVDMATAYPVDERDSYLFYYQPDYAEQLIERQMEYALKVAHSKSGLSEAAKYIFVGGLGSKLIWHEYLRSVYIKYGQLPNVSGLVTPINFNQLLTPIGLLQFTLNPAQDKPEASLMKTSVKYRDVYYPPASFDFYLFVESKEGEIGQLPIKMTAFNSTDARIAGHSQQTLVE